MLESFSEDPWPTWVYRLASGTRIEHELFVASGTPLVALRWRVVGAPLPLRLSVRPFLSGRDSHSIQLENSAFRFQAETTGQKVVWQAYEGVPAVSALTNARYVPEPEWYRGFLYTEERARGLDAVEDLAAPGVFSWDLAGGDAVMLLAAGGALRSERVAVSLFAKLRAGELARRSRCTSRLERAADCYLVRRGDGKTIVAGYPWFTDWGRDTFISLRGLCVATQRLGEARAILLEWAGQVSEGMLPNRFEEHGGAPVYNTVDASLWYVIAVHDYLAAMKARGFQVAAARDQRELGGAVKAILAGHVRGARYRIRVTGDGLLEEGEPGLQLTWMDAKVGDWVITPRIGKPVEVQALWLNALRIAEIFTPAYRPVFEKGMKSFAHRFWNEAGGYLYDVVDGDHQPGQVDASFRPNQIFAVGGLPYSIIGGTRARRIVDEVERMLLTPLGLRTLAPGSPGYRPAYQGDLRSRDAAYHQGTVWPWLLGAFVEAWTRVRGDTLEVRRAARERFLSPLMEHLDRAGLGHISEITDAEPPFTPRGCPFQAWSVAEVLRLDRQVLAESLSTSDSPNFTATTP
jgi:predicted glycogen debranching enzyme